MPEKTSECLLEQLEKLEAEELQKVMEIAEKAKITLQQKGQEQTEKDTTSEDVKYTRPIVHGNQRH